MIEIRPLTPDDVAAIDALQDDPVWTGADYLNWTTFVATDDDGRIAGFACGRTLVPNTEHEVLNVLVASKHRGKGIGSKLMKTLLEGAGGIWFLEVREGNAIARRLYKSLGFSDFGRRKGYYQNPYEDAIVMRFCS